MFASLKLWWYGAQLRSRKVETRVRAAKALGKLSGPGSIELLLCALEDHHFRVRAAVVNALRAVGGPHVVKGLARALRDDESEVVFNAAKALGELGDLPR